jgi:hypothetical protein
MNEQELVVYSVYVGIGWADKKHDVCIQSKHSEVREFAVIRHRPEAIDTWVKGLHQRYEGRIAGTSWRDRHFTIVRIFSLPTVFLKSARTFKNSAGSTQSQTCYPTK